MAPDSVPKSGTKIGAAFYDDSTSLDWKVGRFPDPEPVPDSAVNLSRMHVIVDAPCPQHITTSVYTFLQCLMDCEHPPKFVNHPPHSLLRLQLRQTLPHNALEQRPQPSGAKGSFKKWRRLAALEIVPLLLCIGARDETKHTGCTEVCFRYCVQPVVGVVFVVVVDDSRRHRRRFLPLPLIS